MLIPRGAVGGFMLGVVVSGGAIWAPVAVSQSLTSPRLPLAIDVSPECPPPGAGTLGPPPPAEATPPVTQTPADEPRGAFQICRAGDAQLEQAIERLIAGRSFSLSLQSRSDDCADLTVEVTSATPGRGRQSSTVSVGVGRGRAVTLNITSENGQTRVTISGGA